MDLLSLRLTLPKLSLPNTCAVCRASTQHAAGRLCEACRARWAAPRTRCRSCALPLPALPPGSAERCGACLLDPPPLSGAIAVADYGFPWDGLLQAFKFHDALDLAPALAAAMQTAWQSHGAPAFDLLLPVPLSAARLRERGYNQAAVLARVLGRQTRTPMRFDLVLRATDTPAQAGLPRAARLAQLRGAFVVDPTHAAAVRDRRIAVIDDVMTTGATVHQVAIALQRAGARSVHAWVFARTP